MDLTSVRITVYMDSGVMLPWLSWLATYNASVPCFGNKTQTENGESAGLTKRPPEIPQPRFSQPPKPGGRDWYASHITRMRKILIWLGIKAKK
uniref:Uncharacterized protein n=1 Tax=Candidatus Kentrum sp. DK TaxID=2126562 RepID=A0A450SXL5_9GAMM|nr:MAG: hypothetical protein BECKDK2373B_GA0170837_107719 [Candidatus Kentron sp. DK]